MIVKVLPMSIQNISCTCAIRTATQKSNKPQKNRAKARFFYILRTALDNSAQSVYNYDSTDLRSVTVTADSGTALTTAYTYDGMGRLTGETTGEDSITYTYDASGNRIGMNQNGTVTAYAYDANNRLLSETVGDTVTTYTYDANGNTLTAGDKTYTYNDRGQQTGYSNGTTAAAYAYNPSGLRKAKAVGGSTKYFVYNGMNIVYEYSESVADGIAYFYGLNRTHNSEGEIYVYNAHGDVVQLVKDNSVVASYTYDAFGNLTSQIGESDNPFLYCGEYYDAETQTYYLRARYYNPANGRFTQQDAWAFMDASDPLSLNLYTYCCNNPVMYVDLTGNWPTFAQIATAVAVVAVGAVLVAATIASAGTVGAVAGAAAATYFGVSATTAAAVTTAATVGTYAVAGGIAATYASDAGEILTGHNVVRDDLMGGNQQAYDAVRGFLTITSYGITCISESFSTPQKVHSTDSNKIRFSQDSIKKEFKDGTTLQTTIAGLRNGSIKPSDITPIRVFEKDGLLYTLDNRRLYAAQQAGVKINYVWATEAEIKNEIWKFTTKNYGTSIRVRE